MTEKIDRILANTNKHQAQLDALAKDLARCLDEIAATRAIMRENIETLRRMEDRLQKFDEAKP